MFDYDEREIHAYLDMTENPSVLRERKTGRRIRFETIEDLLLDEDEAENPEEVMEAIVAKTEESEGEYPGICAKDGEYYVEINCLAAEESEEELVIGLDDMFFGFGYYRYDFDE